MRKLLVCLLLLACLHTTRAAEETLKYQWQLFEKNHNAPLAGRALELSLNVDGISVQSTRETTDKSGVVDFSDFYRVYADIVEKYRDRVQFTLNTNTYDRKAGIPLTFDAPTATPQRLELDLGSILVTGHFVTANGQRVTQSAELYPEPIRPYIDESQLGYEQIRLYETKVKDAQDDKAEKDILVDNSVRFAKDSSFGVYVQPNRTYRLEIVGDRSWTIADLTFDTGNQDSTFDLVVQPKPYVLYGALLNATTQQPIPEKEAINIMGDVDYFNSRGKPVYALFFDKPRAVKLKLSSSYPAEKYRDQTVELTVDTPLQRHDLQLVPLADDARTLEFRLKITGADLDEKPEVPPFFANNLFVNFPAQKAVRAWLYGLGGNNYSRGGEYVGDNTYRFLVPEAGDYRLKAESKFYTIDAPEPLKLEANQILEAKAVAKDTWLTVRVVDEAGKPIGFPGNAVSQRNSEARRNIVTLEDTAPAPPKPRSDVVLIRLEWEPVDVGGALRPDENGELHFLLAKGGDYQLRTNFEQYADQITPVQIETHQSKTVTLTLKRKP